MRQIRCHAEIVGRVPLAGKPKLLDQVRDGDAA